MITFKEFLFDGWHKGQRADRKGDMVSIGNILFFIAGTIGVATKNGYTFGLPRWACSDYFINPLPLPDKSIEYKDIELPWGFSGFDIPDNSRIFGWMQTEKYFSHCEDLVRHYCQMKEVIKPIKDTIFIHYRAYIGVDNIFVKLDREYYLNALKLLPEKRVIVMTDDIKKAKSVIGDGFEYISNTPIEDFYLLANADYVVMSNSSFSWWGAWLSKATTVCPKRWFQPTWGDVPGVPNDTSDICCKNWIEL